MKRSGLINREAYTITTTVLLVISCSPFIHGGIDVKNLEAFDQFAAVDDEEDFFPEPVDGFYNWPMNMGCDFAVSLPALYRILVEDSDFVIFLEEKYLPLFKKVEENPHHAIIDNYLKGYNHEMMGGLEKWSTLSDRELTLLAVLHHPFLIFQMLRRHVYQYQKIHGLLRQQLELVPKEDLTFDPSLKDVEEYAYLLVLMQFVYDFNITEFAHGSFGNFSTGIRLNLYQCIEIADAARRFGMHSSAVKWFAFALNMNEAEKYSTKDRLRKLLQNRLWTSIQEHDKNWTKGGKTSFTLFTSKIYTSSRYLQHPNLFKTAQRQFQKIAKDQKDLDKNIVLGNYLNLCRQSANFQPENKNWNLKCYYHSKKKNPIIRYKMEKLHRKPKLIQIHDFLRGDREMTKLTGNSFNQVKRLKPMPKFTANSASSFMLSQKASLGFTFTSKLYPVDHLRSISRRIEYITGLNLDNDDELSISLNVAGGYHWPEIDSANGGSRDLKNNEIATFMIFLNGVEIGDTVFPLLGLSIRPTAGAALFWRNNGKHLNDQFLHAECPILGQKWVVTKHIRRRLPTQIHSQCPRVKSKTTPKTGTSGNNEHSKLPL